MATSDGSRQYHQNSNAQGESIRQYDRMVNALAILHQIDQLDDPDEDDNVVYAGVLEALALALAAENCSLMLLDDQDQVLRLHVAVSPQSGGSRVYPSKGDWDGHDFAVGEGAVGQVAATGEAVQIADTHLDSTFVPLSESEISARSLLCFPLNRCHRVHQALRSLRSQAQETVPSQQCLFQVRYGKTPLHCAP